MVFSADLAQNLSLDGGGGAAAKTNMHHEFKRVSTATFQSYFSKAHNIITNLHNLAKGSANNAANSAANNGASLNGPGLLSNNTTSALKPIDSLLSSAPNNSSNASNSNSSSYHQLQPPLKQPALNLMNGGGLYNMNLGMNMNMSMNGQQAQQHQQLLYSNQMMHQHDLGGMLAGPQMNVNLSSNMPDNMNNVSSGIKSAFVPPSQSVNK